MKETLADAPTIAAALSDVSRAWASVLAPCTADFLDGALTSAEFAGAVEAAYVPAIGRFDACLAEALGRPLAAPGVVLASPDTQADQPSGDLLAFYPVSITGHNLMRLITVLVDDTHGGLAATAPITDRLDDLDAHVAEIGTLLHRLN